MNDEQLLTPQSTATNIAFLTDAIFEFMRETNKNSPKSHECFRVDY
jgi:hypothetical protein